MRSDLLLELADFVENKVPHGNFGMANWATGSYKKLKGIVFGFTQETEIQCSTSACLCGWATVLWPQELELTEAMDGKVISIEKSFFNLGSRFTVDGQTMKLDYEIVEAPPLHSMCRCTVAPQIEEA